MKFTVVIMSNDGRGAQSVRLSASRVLLGALLVTSVLATALWVGWKVGELTVLL